MATILKKEKKCGCQYTKIMSPPTSISQKRNKDQDIENIIYCKEHKEEYDQIMNKIKIFELFKNSLTKKMNDLLSQISIYNHFKDCQEISSFLEPSS